MVQNILLKPSRKVHKKSATRGLPTINRSLPGEPHKWKTFPESHPRCRVRGLKNYLIWFINLSYSDICQSTCVIWIAKLALTHWGRVTHICVGDLTIIGSDDGLSPGRHRAIILTNAAILLMGLLWTNFSEISIETLTLSLKRNVFEVSSAKGRPCCLGLNVLSGMAWVIKKWEIPIKVMLCFDMAHRRF